MLPFLSVISNGSGLNGVDILFCFGCFINTLSPTFKSVFLAWLHLSAYSVLVALSNTFHQHSGLCFWHGCTCLHILSSSPFS